MQDVDYVLCEGRQIFTLDLTMLGELGRPTSAFITEKERHVPHVSGNLPWAEGLDRIKKKASGQYSLISASS